MQRTLVLVLGGGRGERMGFFCHKRAKPTLPFAASFRVIDFTISNCINSRLTNIAVVTDYQRNSVSHCLDDGLLLWQRTGVSFNLLKPVRGSYRGTADAVFQNLSYIESCGADMVLILAGDHIYKMDYRPFIDFHISRHAEVTVAVTSVPIEEAHRFGLVTVGAQGQIARFIEKPRLPKSNLASMGIYVFNREVLLRCLAEDSQDKTSSHDFGHSVLPRMVGRDRVFAYEFNDYWRDIGTVESYYETSLELLHERPSITMNGHWPILTGDSTPTPTRVFSGGVLDNSLAGPGCVIRGRVSNSILFTGVEVAEGAMIKDSLIFPHSFVGKHSIVECCILDERVIVGAGCQIGFGPGGLLNGSSDLTLIGADVEIPPLTIIGKSCRVLPGVRPADFSATVVVSGSVISPGKAESEHDTSSTLNDHAEHTTSSSVMVGSNAGGERV